MFSSIGHGFFIALDSTSTSDTPRVAKRIAQSAWGLFDISATDLIRLRQAAELGLAAPELESLRCIDIRRSRHTLADC